MSIDAHVFAPPTDHVAQAHRDWSQMVVPPAMLVAAGAMGIAGHLHLGLSAEVAMAIGVALFCLMLMCHVLLRAAAAAERAEDEAAERGSDLVDSPMPAAELPARSPAQAIAYPMAAETGHGRSPRIDMAFEQPQAPPPLEAAHASTSDQAFTGAAPIAANAAAWDFRPVDMRLPATGQQGAEQLGVAGHAGTDVHGHSAQAPGVLPPPLGELRPTFEAHAIPSTGARPEVDREAERIDQILKRLAAQIQSGSAARIVGEPHGAAPPPPVPAAEMPLEAMAVTEPDTALSSAVDALRSTVEAMRGAMESKPAPQPVPMSTVSPAELRIAAVAEALYAERVEVFLSPILGLNDEQARHFEVSVQLRGASAEVLDRDAVAEGAGLLPLLDALNVRHAVGFALKLERRGREGAVFSRVASQSLQSEQFVTDVAGRHAQGIADRLVLSFAQDEMRGLGPAQLDALGDLGRLGFRFSLQGVADLDMDFEALQALGFEFVKLEAAVFLGGLTCNGSHIPASDICQHFEDLGLAIIVSGIHDTATREQMIGCGVQYGQGPLFGEPRPVPFAGVSGGIAA